MAKRGETIDLEVYLYEQFMNKVKRLQGWIMALTVFSVGVNAGTDGYSNSYITAYNIKVIPYIGISTNYNDALILSKYGSADTKSNTWKEIGGW